MFVPAQVDTDGNNGRCCHKQDVWDGSQRGKHGVLSYVGLSEETKSESVVSSCTWKKPGLSHAGIMGLQLQRGVNLISHMMLGKRLKPYVGYYC